MDFSLLFFSGDGATQGPDKYKLYLESSKLADQNGFSAIWTPERHFHPFGGLYPSPAVGAAALAMITQHVQLRAGSVVLPINQVPRVVEQWAMVDNLSNGRVALSFAPGWVANDFVLAPDHFANRKAVMHEGIELFRKLWAGEPYSARNGNGDLVSVPVFPKPLTENLPIWLTSRGTAETFRMAGERGYHVLTHLLGQDLKTLTNKINIYREAWQAANHEGRGAVALMMHTFVSDSVDFVKKTVKEPLTNYLGSSLTLLESVFKSINLNVDMKKLTPDDINSLLAFSFERYYGNSGLFGTPDTCQAFINRIAELGVDEIACLIDFGIDTDTALDNLKHLIDLKARIIQPNS